MTPIRHQPDDSEISSAERVLERVVLLVFVASLIVGGGLVSVGILAGQGSLLVQGAVGCGVAWLSREWLCQRGRFDALVSSFDRGLGGDETGGGEGGGEESELLRLARLLRQLDAMERRRGRADFDPWALQSLRHEIRELAANDPGVTRLFEHVRRAA